MLKDGRFHIIAEDGAEDVHDLAQRRVDLDGFNDRRHGVFCSLSDMAQILQGTLHSYIVTLATNSIEAFKMRSLTHLINVKRWDFDILFHDEVVDADDGTFVLVDLLLIAVGRLGNFTLEEAIQNTGQYTTQRVNTVQIVQSRLFRLVCQSLDKVGTAQRINGIDDATLIGDDLLSAQSDQYRLLGRQGQSFVQRVGVQRVGTPN